MKEIWKPIKDWEDYYEVSNLGRVRSLNRTIIRKNGQRLTCKGKILSHSTTSQGYLRALLKVNGHGKHFQVHRLVAYAFIPNPENLTFVNHRDGNKENNRASNLEWVSASQNTRHAFATGLIKRLKGEENPMAKLTATQVEEIRRTYIPYDKEYGGFALAIKYGISRKTIYEIVHHKRY